MYISGAINAGCDTFLTVDKKILNKFPEADHRIKVMDPVNFVLMMEKKI